MSKFDDLIALGTDNLPDFFVTSEQVVSNGDVDIYCRNAFVFKNALERKLRASGHSRRTVKPRLKGLGHWHLDALEETSGSLALRFDIHGAWYFRRLGLSKKFGLELLRVSSRKKDGGIRLIDGSLRAEPTHLIALGLATYVQNFWVGRDKTKRLNSMLANLSQEELSEVMRLTSKHSIRMPRRFRAVSPIELFASSVIFILPRPWVALSSQVLTKVKQALRR